MNKIESDGTEYTETKEVLKWQCKFYENVYSDNLINADERPIEDIIGENENSHQMENQKKLEGDINLTNYEKF